MSLRLAMMFQDGCVLQREKVCPVWGCANPGDDISVSIQGQTVKTKADSLGNWKVRLESLTASEDETLVVRGVREELALRHIAVGEVWLLGGQSNMEFQMRYDAELQAELTKDHFENIRFFAYPQVSYEGEMEDFDYSAAGWWRQATKENLEYFGAVGYYFANAIAPGLHVPIGLLACNWGGTPSCAWMDKETVKKCGSVWLEEYENALKEQRLGQKEDYFLHEEWRQGAGEAERVSRTAYEAAYRSSSRVADHCRIFNEGNDFIMNPMSPEQQQFLMSMMEKAADVGEEAASEMVSEIMGPFHQNRPCGLYQTMLRHVAPYSVRGVLWYQGESDSDHADLYENMFTGLVGDWRGLWKEEIPFFCVQLAPFGKWLACSGKNYEIVRANQQAAADHLEKVYLASIGDVGNEIDIHPKKKRLVGERLALLAQKYVYGEDLAADAPRLAGACLENGMVRMDFSDTNGALKAVGDPGKEFEILDLQNGENLDRENYQVEVRGESLFLQIISGDLRNRLLRNTDMSGFEAGSSGRINLRITYCWRDYYEANLYGGTGLPVFPFEIEVLKND